MVVSPEWQLMLACAHTHGAPQDVHQIVQHLGRGPVDWHRLTAQACYHGIAPLLYDHLQQANATSMLPHEALAILQRASYATALRNAVLYRALRQVLDALAAAAIPVVVLKGAALADTVYPRRAWRPMSDIDLLLHPAEFSQAEQVLRDMGYAHKAHRRLKEWQQAHHDVAFIPPADSALHPPVELHWHIERPGSSFRIDLEGLWVRAVAVRLAGVATHMLAPEDMLLHLCLHTCRHAGAPNANGMVHFRLLSFVDLAAVIRQAGPALEWETLVRRAHAWRAQPYVYLALALARTVLGAAVPPPVLEDLRPAGFDARLLAWACAALLEAPGPVPLFRDLLTLGMGRRVTERAAVVAKLLSPRTVARAYGLSPGTLTVYGYYPARLRHLLRRYGPVLWRLLRHDRQLRVVADGKAQLAAWLASGWGKPP